MKIKHLILIILPLILVVTPVYADDYQEGVDAFLKKDFKAALKKFDSKNLIKRLWKKDRIYVRARSPRVASEEAPGAYKNVSDVVDVCHASGIANKVVRLKPMGVVKG